MSSIERFLNSLIPFIVTLVILAAFALQVFVHEVPCPLCYLQRVGMIAAGIGFLLNLRFGVHMSHYGLVLFSAFFGGFVALRQMFLHICPGTPPFGTPFLGLSLYTWSFFIHVSFVLAVAFLLFLFRQNEPHTRMTKWEKTVLSLFFVMVLGNILSTYLQCELGPCADIVTTPATQATPAATQATSAELQNEEFN